MRSRRSASILDDALAIRKVIHGVLLDILGLGVLIIGESGIGKSECALDLVVRGHRLVADDTVEVRRRGDDEVIGTCPELTRHHMELRGLGCDQHQRFVRRRLDAALEANRARRAARAVGPSRGYDRLGLDEPSYELFGVKVPIIHMPVAPGRSLAILVEVAARNQLLRSRGLNAARDLATRLEHQLRLNGRRDDAGRRRRARGPVMKVSARNGAAEQPAFVAGAAHGLRRFVILTGLSGSGKTHAIRALEDLGYFCIDNLPTQLLPTMAELSSRDDAGLEKVAIVVDVREGGFLSQFPRIYRKLQAMPGLRPTLIFLEASHSALVRRFSETRRPHPLAPDRSVTEGITEEREKLNVIRSMADLILDTSNLTVHELRDSFMRLSRDEGPARRWWSIW